MDCLFPRACRCFRSAPRAEDLRSLDRQHSGLRDVPREAFAHERTLEELLLAHNKIRDLPPELFYCHGLRRLKLSSNDLSAIPAAIASLVNLEELDISKNSIIEVPESIKGCKFIQVLECSVNPLGRLPEGFTHLLQLTELYLNDTFLDYLPGNFGRLSKLRILELRENQLRTLPNSFSLLEQLERLDLGVNDFEQLPDVLGSLGSLLELWCDNNQLKCLSRALGRLQSLIYLDASRNTLRSIAEEIGECAALADLHLGSNALTSLPDSIGDLQSLTTLRVEDNRLSQLPDSLGRLQMLSELNVTHNELDTLPSSVGLLRNLRTLYADENELQELPAEIGSCSGLTVLSLYGNQLQYVPDEIGRIPRLRVINLADNLVRFLPFSVTRLKHLQALWLSHNQSRPLIPLQTDIDVDTGQRMLTCYVLPQQPTPHAEPHEESDSFQYTDWENQRAPTIQFNVKEAKARAPVSYPKEGKVPAQHRRNESVREQMRASQDKLDAAGTAGAIGPDMVYLGESGGAKSPLTKERHRLLHKDKEKQVKDKARMSKSASTDDILSAKKSVSIQLDSEKKKKKRGNDRNTSSVLSASSPDVAEDARNDKAWEPRSVQQLGAPPNPWHVPTAPRHVHRSRETASDILPRTRTSRRTTEGGYRSDMELYETKSERQAPVGRREQRMQRSHGRVPGLQAGRRAQSDNLGLPPQPHLRQAPLASDQLYTSAASGRSIRQRPLPETDESSSDYMSLSSLHHHLRAPPSSASRDFRAEPQRMRGGQGPRGPPLRGQHHPLTSFQGPPTSQHQGRPAVRPGIPAPDLSKYQGNNSQNNVNANENYGSNSQSANYSRVTSQAHSDSPTNSHVPRSVSHPEARFASLQEQASAGSVPAMSRLYDSQSPDFKQSMSVSQTHSGFTSQPPPQPRLCTPHAPSYPGLPTPQAPLHPGFPTPQHPHHRFPTPQHPQHGLSTSQAPPHPGFPTPQPLVHPRAHEPNRSSPARPEANSDSSAQRSIHSFYTSPPEVSAHAIPAEHTRANDSQSSGSISAEFHPRTAPRSSHASTPPRQTPAPSPGPPGAPPAHAPFPHSSPVSNDSGLDLASRGSSDGARNGILPPSRAAPRLTDTPSPLPPPSRAPPSFTERLVDSPLASSHSPLPSPPTRAAPLLPASPSPSSQTLSVTVNKAAGLGFSIAGGVGSAPYRATHGEAEGVFIANVNPHGPAKDVLCPGDQLLQIEDRSVRGADHNTVVQLLREAPAMVNLHVYREPQQKMDFHM